MIAYLKGEIVDITEDNVVIEVNNIGYNVKISTNVANFLPGIGNQTKIYTYTMVKEDAFQLYGFLTRDDLEIFKKLITVNGIGPKGALAILSIMNADSLRFAIVAGDAKAIAKAPGIGSKTAERLILDLRDKVSIEDTLQHVGEEKGIQAFDNQGNQEAQNEAIEALIALGYSASDALRAIKAIEITEDMDANVILKQALRKVSVL